MSVIKRDERSMGNEVPELMHDGERDTQTTEGNVIEDMLGGVSSNIERTNILIRKSKEDYEAGEKIAFKEYDFAGEEDFHRDNKKKIDQGVNLLRSAFYQMKEKRQKAKKELLTKVINKEYDLPIHGENHDKAMGASEFYSKVLKSIMTK